MTVDLLATDGEYPLYRINAHHTGLLAGTRLLSDSGVIDIEQITPGMLLSGTRVCQVRKIWVGGHVRISTSVRPTLCCGLGLLFPLLSDKVLTTDTYTGKDHVGCVNTYDVTIVDVLSPAYIIWMATTCRVVIEGLDCVLPDIPVSK